MGKIALALIASVFGTLAIASKDYSFRKQRGTDLHPNSEPKISFAPPHTFLRTNPDCEIKHCQPNKCQMCEDGFHLKEVGENVRCYFD